MELKSLYLGTRRKFDDFISYRENRKALKDLAIISAITVITLAIAFFFEIFEILADVFLREEFERLDLDEFLIALLVLSFVFGLFFLLRWIDLRHEITERSLAETALQKARDELEIRVQERTRDLVEANVSLEAEMAERQRAMEDLKESEVRFRTIFETAQDCVFIKDLEGRYIHVNPATEMLFETPAAEIVGKRDEAFFGQEAAAHIDDVDSRVLSGGIVNEEHTKPVKGVPITFNIIKVPLRDGTGQITGLCGIARDVTERERAERLFIASAEAANALLTEEDLGSAVNTTLGLLARAVDADRAYVFENHYEDGEPFMSALFEWSSGSADPLINNPTLQKFPYHPDSTRLYEALSAGEPFKGLVKDFPASERSIFEPLGAVSILIVPITADDRLRGFVGFDDCHSERVWTGNEVSVLLAAAGSIAGAIMRKRADQELLEGKVRLRTILDSIEAGFLIVDPKTHQIVDANLVALEMIGADKSQVVGSVCHRFICPTEVGNCPITDMGLHVDNSERVLINKDGISVPIIKSVVPVKLNDAEYLLESFVDITELKRAKDDLIRAQTELERRVDELNQKNAEMERFTYTVSHDLRSPLVTIQGFLGFLKEDVNDRDEERIATDVDMITRAVDKMDYLLRDTLQLSRIGRVANPPENVPFGEIVGDMMSQISEKARSKGVEISTAKEWPSVHVDRLRISEVLVNLVENSIRYMGDQPDPRIELGWRKDGGEVVFFVRDNGIGIDTGQQKKVFELFYKADPDSEGTGAGLAIVKRIIEVHGGRVWIESEDGEGSTFCFTLPVVGD